MRFNWLLPRFEMDSGAAGGGGGYDGGAGAGDGGTPAAPATPEPVNPLLDESFGAEPPAQPDLPVQPTVEELDFAGRKVPVVDPVIRDLHRDYSELQRTFQETNQNAKQLQEQNQMFQQMIQFFQQQQQAPQQAQPPAPAEPALPSPEDNEQFMNQWYDSPIATVQELIQRQVQQLVESQVKPVIEPIQRERQYSQEIQQLSQRHADFQQHLPVMQQLVQQNPQLAEQGLETVYWVARGQQAQAQPTYTPEQMLNDPQFRQQLLGNEGLRNEIVSTYMQQRQQTNQQVPPVMGNQPGGSPPAMPEQRPKSIREASKMFSKYLGLGQ